MITALDIIDTAVKIGLGAAITAVSAHFVAKRSQSHELRKLRLQEASQLLRESAGKFEQCSTLINHANHILFNLANKLPPEEPFHIDESIRDLTDAFNAAKEARSLCCLLGHSDIGDSMVEYASEIDSLMQHYLRQGRNFDVSWVNDNGDKRSLLKRSILTQLARAYESTYAYPSIEGMPKKLRFLRTPHVKR